MFKPKYTISNQILNQLSEIAQIKTIVARARLLPEREAFLRRAALIKMAHSSTSIEGNTLNEYQIEQIASGKEVHAEARQIKEVKNYFQALNLIDKISSERNNFTVKDILSIHKIVTIDLIEEEKRGVLRKGQVWIVNEIPFSKYDEVVYTPPRAEFVGKLLKDLITWLDSSKNLHPIIRAGLFHYQFETIHPFPDGNGRTGRLLSLLHLYQSDWAFRKILVLEDYYNNNRLKYYQRLQTGETYLERQDVDLTKWLEYYIEGFLAETKRINDLMLGSSGIQDIEPTRNKLNKDELKIIDFVISLGQITSSDVVDILEIPKRTAQSKLKKLEEIKILKKEGAGPTTYYELQIKE